jgi:hypothetical protein
MNDFEKQICLSRNNCFVCRNDAAWRLMTKNMMKLPSVDFPCEPLNLPIGAPLSAMPNTTQAFMAMRTKMNDIKSRLPNLLLTLKNHAPKALQGVVDEISYVLFPGGIPIPCQYITITSEKIQPADCNCTTFITQCSNPANDCGKGMVCTLRTCIKDKCKFFIAEINI